MWERCLERSNTKYCTSLYPKRQTIIVREIRHHHDVAMRNVFCCLLLLLISFNGISTPSSSILLQRFTHYAISAQHTWQVPGMAVAIIEQGKLVYARGFGVRNNKNQPVIPNTIFDIASS